MPKRALEKLPNWTRLPAKFLAPILVNRRQLFTHNRILSMCITPLFASLGELRLPVF
jgi:hypothetical protein